MRDGGRSASSPPVRFGRSSSPPPVRFGSFLETSGDVALPMGASSLFLSVVFSAPNGAFSSVGFFFFAFFGFLSSNLRTSSFSFCFADDEFLRSLAFFLRCSCVDEKRCTAPRRASSPGKQVVGGLFFDFEPFRTPRRYLVERPVIFVAGVVPRAFPGREVEVVDLVRVRRLAGLPVFW